MKPYCNFAVNISKLRKSDREPIVDDLNLAHI